MLLLRGSVDIDLVGTRALPAAPSSESSASLPRRPYLIGIINYRTYDDLDDCLDCVKSQTHRPSAVLVVDVDPDPELHQRAAERHPEVTWLHTPNHGFGAGANVVLRWAAAQERPVEFSLIMNPDVAPRPTFGEELVTAMHQQPEAALASGKLLRRDGVTLDSAGIVLPRNRRPRDRGSEEIDRGQYDEPGCVFGVSGAAIMIRRSAAEDLAIMGEVFDEDFFLYHEDSDLCWRTHRLGWRVLYVPTAEALHGRRWQRARRFEIAPHVRLHSFKNHYLSMLKNERPREFLRDLPVILVWELARLGYALLFDREVLAGYGAAWRLRGRMLAKRRILRRKAAAVAVRSAPRNPDVASKPVALAPPEVGRADAGPSPARERCLGPEVR